MTAKAYVHLHQDLIFAALQNRSVTYADLRAAIAEDGINISRQYFKELMLSLKRQRAGYKPARNPIADRKEHHEKQPEPVTTSLPGDDAAPLETSKHEKGGLLANLRARFAAGDLDGKILDGKAARAAARANVDRGE